MKSFKVAEGAYVADGVEHPIGDVIELDESTQEVQDAVAAGVLVAVEAAPAPEAPKPLGFFSLDVKWREGTTEEEQAAAMPWIQESTAQMAQAAEDLFPDCIDAFTVKRDR